MSFPANPPLRAIPIDLPASTDMCTYTALINDSAADYCEAKYNSAPTTIILQEIKV